MPDFLLELQNIGIDTWRSGRCAGTTRDREATIVVLWVKGTGVMELFVIVFLQGDFNNGLKLCIPLLGNALEVTIGCTTQSLQSSGRS